MKKYYFIFLFFMASFPALAQSAFNFDFSVAYQPFVNWESVDLMFFDDAESNLNFDLGQYIVFRSNIRHRSGINFGFGLGIDSGYDRNNNFVGVFSDILALLGYNNFSIRVSHGRLSGIDRNNNGERFIGDLTSVALLYDIRPGWFFIGINYTYLSSPAALAPAHMNSTRGNAVTHLYGIIIGQDSFSIFNDVDLTAIQMAPWLEGWVSLGLGRTTYRTTNENFFAMDLRFDYTLGILLGWGTTISFTLGLGYNWNRGFSLFHHGFVGRLGVSTSFC